ncbi:MAG: sigma-70 family RNA polymerase sigma factor, partial [Clostridia bacterium]|nr:sigma-70 family RNA polymerase sigma factor [Clostridia bacterium]
MERNEKEFERIVQTHKTTIYTVCYMFSKDEEEVNDLFQDTLVNLWKGMESFKGNCKIE